MLVRYYQRHYKAKPNYESENSRKEKLTIEKESNYPIPKPPIISIPKPPISLATNKRIDYSKLQTFLENLQWQKADIETRLILEQISGFSQFNYLDNQSISKLPCTDLQTIDNLWLHYSNCHFGFTVQSKLLLASKENLNLFGEWVGWSKQGVCINNSDLIYDLTAPRGHLPVAYIPIVGGYLWIVLGSVIWLSKRLHDCHKNYQ
ncbi:GUN4 domain-containing protein [Okeania sp. KiyG1]|uniref:GUN4 domain-containing protein n=1 Tax=Okeania sp. KiyG1 TaxID=2720165 RepID=UPI00192110FC|nr:GUN4 domain-containing protein [Okeania sp. KiyG1]